VVSTDALLTQRKFCQDLCDADYVMPVKENQRKLLGDIRTVFEPGTSPPHAKTYERSHKDLGAHTDTCSTIEKENGWIQKRTMTISTILPV